MVASKGLCLRKTCNIHTGVCSYTHFMKMHKLLSFSTGMRYFPKKEWATVIKCSQNCVVFCVVPHWMSNTQSEELPSEIPCVKPIKPIMILTLSLVTRLTSVPTHCRLCQCSSRFARFWSTDTINALKKVMCFISFSAMLLCPLTSDGHMLFTSDHPPLVLPQSPLRW